MGPGLRKASLTAHVVTSVGWLGAVATTLGLGVAGLTSDDPIVVRGAYATLEATGWWVLVPLSFLSLGTGVTQAMVTRWGLLSHYWVVIKLAMNVLANIVLLLYMGTIEHLADLARNSELTGGIDSLRDPSPVLHASAALVLLVAATALSVYKPPGLTRRGQRQRHARTPSGSATAAT
jgi:hypothetical protein